MEKGLLRYGGIPSNSHNVESRSRPVKVTFVDTLLLLYKCAKLSVDCCVCGLR